MRSWYRATLLSLQQQVINLPLDSQLLLFQRVTMSLHSPCVIPITAKACEYQKRLQTKEEWGNSFQIEQSVILRAKFFDGQTSFLIPALTYSSKYARTDGSTSVGRQQAHFIWKLGCKLSTPLSWPFTPGNFVRLPYCISEIIVYLSILEHSSQHHKFQLISEIQTKATETLVK